MKKFLFIIFIFVGILHSSAQMTFIGFDQPICGSAPTNVYTYANYSSGGGSSTIYGYRIYRNGIQVYDISGSMGTGQHCEDLIFINDSTGFAVGACGGCGAYVLKTSNYGNTWTNIGSTALGYMGLYVVNANYCYLVCSPNAWQFFIQRCSDLEAPSVLVYDDTTNTDVYKTDTIFGNSLCNIDSLNVLITNSSGDTIDYHINLHSLPVGIDERISRNFSYSIYPNPARNKITVEGSNFNKAEIYNLQGRKILESVSQIMDVENFISGLYLVKVITRDNKTYYLKFMKEE